jgi:glyoxylase-like metal-dependent hydrolase (beta-lactamase superfamily II)
MSQKEPFMYTANDLYDWLTDHPDFLLLDVRNEKDFSNFAVEGPECIPYINIPYFDFIEDVPGSVAKIPPGKKIRVVCAKEGSAKFVSEQLLENGFNDVGYMQEGIKGWGNMLTPVKVSNDNDSFEIYQMIRPGKASLSYILISNGEAAVFDPSRNLSVYLDFAQSKNSKLTKSFETHRQADYISGSVNLSRNHGIETFGRDEDFRGADFPCTAVSDKEIIKIGKTEVQVIHTPGHTLGSICLLVDNKYFISGDTIFIESAGRPDLGGKCEEWSRYLYLSLMITVKDLPDDLLVLPGHYSSWSEANENLIFIDTLGNLKKHNTAFQYVHEGKFAEFIKDNIRPQPEVYADIRKMNAGWMEACEDEQDTMDLGKNECGASNYGKVGVSAESERQE